MYRRTSFTSTLAHTSPFIFPRGIPLLCTCHEVTTAYSGISRSLPSRQSSRHHSCVFPLLNSCPYFVSLITPSTNMFHDFKCMLLYTILPKLLWTVPVLCKTMSFVLEILVTFGRIVIPVNYSAHFVICCSLPFKSWSWISKINVSQQIAPSAWTIWF